MVLPSTVAFTEIETFYSGNQGRLFAVLGISGLGVFKRLRLQFRAKTCYVHQVRTLVATLATCLFWLTAAFAQAPGSPETVLAGIDIHHTKVADMMKLYGEPEGVYAAPEPYPAGTRQYKWGRLTLTLMVLTEPSPTGDKITAIQIQGQGDGKAISSTGRGLKLSDKPQRVKKLYSVDAVNPSTSLEWPSGETLLIHLDDKLRIDRLELKLKNE